MEKKNNINITEILKNCPEGMKLYSPLLGDVKLVMSGSNNVSVLSENANGDIISNIFTENGLFNSGYSQAECLLFPSSRMRDWTKFFKHGDVVITHDGTKAGVFDKWCDDTYTTFFTSFSLYNDGSSHKGLLCGTKKFHKATDGQRAYFIMQAERILKGKYNPDTLQVEPVKPTCPLKPFDKVLVRDTDEQAWCANYFSHYKNDPDYFYVCINGSYHYCIPYNEHTAHLLGTTDPYTKGGSK